jgi:DNA-binding CsgD family transcriptional regulator
MGTGLITQVIAEQEWAVLARRLKASPQQVRIVRLIIEEDLNTPGIAYRLGVSPRSVETQLTRLYAKLKHPFTGEQVQSKAGLLVAVFVEVWRLREETASRGGAG